MKDATWEKTIGFSGLTRVGWSKEKCFVQPKMGEGKMMKKKKNNKGRHDFLRRSCLV